MKNIDRQVADFLAPLVGSPTPGVYTISLPDQYWRTGIDGEPLAALLDRIKERVVSYENRHRVDLRSLSPAELRQMLEKHFGGKWLSKDAEHSSALEARRAWESKEWRSQALAVSMWVAYWASSAAVLAWLVHSIHVFFFRLYQTPARGLRRFTSPWVAQLIIGAVGVVPAFLMPYMFWPGTLLVPVVVVVLLAEGWAGFRSRHVAPRS